MDLYCFILTWGTVIGLLFDIVGAFLIWLGVSTSIKKANALEEIAMPELFDDIGSTENLDKNRKLSKARSQERVKASRFALIGLLFLVFGFGLQIVASWPQ